MTEKVSKSKALNELEKNLSKQRKQKSEDLIKKKLDKKELDYDSLINSRRFWEIKISVANRVF
ncbi:MAG: hypothetical protein OEM77_00410 [Nitrosopumilus sp.]|nr:hypothetical protein [Nitrosopumilus sp.]MDH3736372.1 hypothetical protein [Nitrosopumilus sp.]MDH3822311.1 hypothetical protein [Nitrosopumilus sp.]MDH3834852.1 hypothetical protein [Nitrosopumilus sp.]